NQRAGQAVGTMTSRAGAATGGVAGVVGAGIGIGVNAMISAGTRGAVVGSDVANQMGVGHNNYVPDFQPAKPRRPGRAKSPEQRGEQNGQPGGDGHGDRGAVETPTPAQANPSTGGDLAGTAASGGGGGGAAGAAGGVT